MLLSPRILSLISIVFALVLWVMICLLLTMPEWFSSPDFRYQLKTKRKPWLERFALFLSDAIAIETLGVGYSLLTVILLLLGEWKLLGIALTSIVFSSILFFSLKRITQRSRPTDALIQLSDYSFPSGHTSAGFVMCLTIGFFLARNLDGREAAIIWAFALLAGMIVGWSRRYLKVHRISDIIAGAVLGMGSFLASYLFFFYYGDAIISAIERVFMAL